MKPYFEDEHVKIYHGDSRKLLLMMPKVDLVLTDPPYGIGYDPARRATVSNGTRTYKDYGAIEWDQSPFNPSPMLLRDQRAIIWGANNFASGLPDQGGWLCWVKTARDEAIRLQGEFELAWTNCIQRPRVFHHVWMGCSRNSESQIANFHPTQKPLALMRWCLGLVKDVQTVIDPYMGSGTTLRAAKDIGIKAIGIEIEERYCEIAARRMAQEVLSFEAPAVELSAAALFEE